FSFGIVSYEVFTNRAPFAGSTAIDTLAQILHVEPQPLTVLDRRLPPELERIVGRCLQKEPQARYEATRALVDDLQRVEGKPGSASAVALHRLKRRLSVSTVLRAVGIVAALALAGSLAVKFQGRKADRDGKQTATLPGATAAAASPHFIVVADFEGTGVGEDVRTATREFVTAALAQSNVVTPLTHTQVLRGLKLAAKPDTTRVVGEVAHELAARASAGAYLAGRVDKLLGGYSIVLNVVDVGTRNVVVTVNGIAKNDQELIT